MKHYLYCSSGNTEGLDEYIGYFENDGGGHCVRYVEIQASGTALRYSEGNAADKYAQLPEGKWIESEATKAAYGHCIQISGDLFDTVWAKTTCDNGKTE